MYISSQLQIFFSKYHVLLTRQISHSWDLCICLLCKNSVATHTQTLRNTTNGHGTLFASTVTAVKGHKRCTCVATFNWFWSNSSCNEHRAAKASQVLTLGRDMTKSCSWAFWAASMTFSIVASFVLLPYLILSAMLQSNSTGSCDTIPIFDLRNCTFMFLESCPSINYKEMGEKLKHLYKTPACNTQIVYSKTKLFNHIMKTQTQLI